MEIGEDRAAGEAVDGGAGGGTGGFSPEDLRRLEAVRARIMAYRDLHALTQEAFAEECGISRSMVANIERRAYLPGIAVRRKLSAALGVSPGRLFDPPA